MSSNFRSLKAVLLPLLQGTSDVCAAAPGAPVAPAVASGPTAAPASDAAAAPDGVAVSDAVGDAACDAVAALDVPPVRLANALLALLPLGGVVTARAARLFGEAVARLAAGDEGERERARTFIRRLMWHMNEDSGNIGWGIPEAFGESLAASPLLARDFHRVLISYIVDTGHADNFCDQPVLRRSCYEALIRLAEAQPDLPGFVDLALPALQRAQTAESDPECRERAAFLHARLAPRPHCKECS